ncbi:NADH dehydrogenase [subsurface metagenome]
MPVLDEKIKEDVKGMFKDLKEQVKLIVFTQDGLIKVPGIECETCKDNRMLMEEIASLSDKISIEVYDFVKDKNKAEQYKIDKIPATIVLGQKDHGIRLYGMPTGYEFPTLLNSIKMVSTANSELSNETKEKLTTLSKPVHIQVFVTLTCPYCSSAVVTAHRMALENDNVTADMVNAQEFPQLAQKYNVFSVPKIVINETAQFEGSLPENAFVQKIVESVK